MAKNVAEITTKTTKVTRRENLTAIAAILADIEGTETLRDFVAAELTAIDSAVEKNRVKRAEKSAATAEENAVLLESVIESMTAGQGYTPSELAEANGISPQKLSRLISSAIADGKVCRIKEGRQTYYALA